jgi:hypothetical protein
VQISAIVWAFPSQECVDTCPVCSKSLSSPAGVCGLGSALLSWDSSLSHSPEWGSIPTSWRDHGASVQGERPAEKVIPAQGPIYPHAWHPSLTADPSNLSPQFQPSCCSPGRKPLWEGHWERDAWRLNTIKGLGLSQTQPRTVDLGSSLGDDTWFCSHRSCYEGHTDWGWGAAEQCCETPCTNYGSRDPLFPSFIQHSETSIADLSLLEDPPSTCGDLSLS